MSVACLRHATRRPEPAKLMDRTSSPGNCLRLTAQPNLSLWGWNLGSNPAWFHPSTEALEACAPRHRLRGETPAAAQPPAGLRSPAVLGAATAGLPAAAHHGSHILR